MKKIVTYLSVVIPCWNEARYLPGLLDALAAQTRPPDEIVIVDGASIDDTAAAHTWAATHPMPAIQIIVNPHRHIPHALNLGIAAARGEVIARLDGHSRPAPDYLAHCLAALEGSGAAVVGGPGTCGRERPARSLKQSPWRLAPRWARATPGIAWRGPQPGSWTPYRLAVFRD